MEETRVPIYLITGFLESGKTSFLNFTLQQDYFQIDGKTLLILCEEGEEEYDAEALKQHNTDVEIIESEEDLTPERLAAMEILYQPERVIIEYNGCLLYTSFRELTNSKNEVKTVDDMKNLKVRVAGSNLLMECYKRWGADATNMNWSETYTALQQNTVEGEENPLPAIDAASVQEVQPYCSMWDAIYDCLFFCINQDIYDLSLIHI